MRTPFSVLIAVGLAVSASAAPSSGSCPPDRDDTLSTLSSVSEAANRIRLRAAPTRFPEELWNGEGNEPNSDYFGRNGKPSELWKALLKNPKLKPFARAKEGFLSVHALERNADGSFDVQVQIYVDYEDPRNGIVTVKNVPAKAALAQLEREPRTNKKAVLPFPLAVYTDEGGAAPLPYVSIRDGKKRLTDMAEFLTVPLQTTAYDPRAVTYVSVGRHDLHGIEIKDVDVSIYGEVTVIYEPTYADYNMDDVHDDGMTFRMFHVDAPAPERKERTFTYAELVTASKKIPAFAPVLAALEPTLGPK